MLGISNRVHSSFSFSLQFSLRPSSVRRRRKKRNRAACTHREKQLELCKAKRLLVVADGAHNLESKRQPCTIKSSKRKRRISKKS